MFGIGICNLLVGKLRDSTSFYNCMMFFLSLGVAAFAIVLGIIVFNVDKDDKLYYGKRDKREKDESALAKPLLQGVGGSDEPLV